MKVTKNAWHSSVILVATLGPLLEGVVHSLVDYMGHAVGISDIVLTNLPRAQGRGKFSDDVYGGKPNCCVRHSQVKCQAESHGATAHHNYFDTAQTRLLQ